MTYRCTKKRQQQGGMKFSREVLKYFIKRGVEHNEEYNDFNIMRVLIANANGVRIVWDKSTYSFIFELTFTHGLIDPYGVDLADSASTFDAFTAATPEPGTRVSTFCAKISFVNDGPSLRKEYKNVRKETVTSDKANREAETQRGLFEAFACRRTTAPFVPDVIAHAILSGDQFRGMFGPSQTNPGILSTTAAATTPGVLGTPKEIYDWIDAWIASDGIMVDVILMEMMDFQRTAPGVPRSAPFQMIYQLRSHQAQHLQAALRMMANIASVRGKGILPTDFHEGNGLATADGLQLYLIDWGGLFNLNIEADRVSLLVIFQEMCKHSRNTVAEADAVAAGTAASTSDPNKKRLARFPSLEELCHFFQIGFDPSNHRDTTIYALTQKFQKNLDGVVDFTCFAPDQQNVHSALMMVAFVDFMANRMNCNYPYCQCGSVLKVVYPVEASKIDKPTPGLDLTAFDDFRVFLRTFEFASVPSKTQLQRVVDMIEENVRVCPSTCGGAPMPVSHLRASSWINEEIMRIREEEAERMRREEAERIRREEAERIRREEAERIRREEAERMRREEAERMRREEAERMRRKRLESARTPGVAKPNLKLDTKNAAKIQSAIAQTAQAQARGASVQEVAVPTSWLSRLSSSLSSKVPSWLKRNGGSRKQRKQCKQCKQRKSFTQRRHN